MKKVFLVILISLMLFSCDNSTDKEDDNSEVVIILKYKESEEKSDSRAEGDPLILDMLDVWVVGVDDDVITTGLNRDTPTASSQTGVVTVLLDSDSIHKIIVRAEYIGGRVFMGYANVIITEFLTTVTIDIYETPGSSAIQSFNDLDEYIKNNF